ncbi:quinoprotein dehydrogenase-associated SoxYZ-like carrier [Methylonatrum kenyense]|uniref:quinoprotein dehydrogenase-associated SoxYZ-like carrier n=1 Tax=Methylonatrum kenyense TaxID=455253 RepID=UPI0020BF3941|nr:quinoprotein dehydrogenase-associated SoxYZ-like carrier [Methylonatrum kenyense]MCK8516038.1 quinoprotein dehydrogenase-associated SoxYZ-like carrier [Methylonatrum kenyense]
MNKLICLMAGVCLCLVGVAHAATEDPMRSPGWRIIEQRFFADQTVVFDDRVQVLAPQSAEDTFAVPGFVRVDGIEDIERLVVITDLNPIQRVLEMDINDAVKPAVGFRFKVQQRTPVRAAVQTSDGTWYLGGTWVDAAGGGCTAPSTASADPDWANRLGEVDAALWARDDGIQRLKTRLVHPMDTGLVDNIPAFYLETLELLDEKGDVLTSLSIQAAMSENPVLSFDLAVDGPVRLQGRDNQGNRIRGMVEP